MSYKIYLWDVLNPIEWSQVGWRVEGLTVPTDDCRQELIHDVMLEQLPKDGLIVDAGCGTGKWVIYLRRLGYRVVGIDLSRDVGGIARRTDPGAELLVADTRSAPLRSQSVDAVLSLGVVEHDEAGPISGLRELQRILKPGGILVLDVPFNNLFRRLVYNPYQTYVTWKRRRAQTKLTFVEYRFTRQELARYLAQTGFEVLAVYPNDYRPPRNMGVWVDYQNLFFNPYAPRKPEDLFMLPGWTGRAMVTLTRRLPWWFCGGVTMIARARH